ncbi:Uma2 family endonuclease [Plasticicumulans sp.]|uniref:Uma2 family endonuclease n=1 Tax=Plasticicumulans sp. TaxID=2307179 RepID=UPI0039508CEC
MTGAPAPFQKEHAMDWQEICASPLLRDLPFKIETDALGRIVMSPASNRHGLYQSRIAVLLSRLLPGGESQTECSVATADGVKVAGVVWRSDAFAARHGDATPYPLAPEIVVEIASPSNTVAELLRKKELYFARGAQEFWMCAGDGALRFFNNHSELAASALALEFPATVARRPDAH